VKIWSVVLCQDENCTGVSGNFGSNVPWQYFFKALGYFSRFREG